MPGSDSPAVARYRVRHAIRAAREAMGLTQTQVANAMDWSLSKVMRIENGDVNVAPNDLKPLLDLLEERDRDSVDRLVEGARRARQERWTIDPDIRKHFTPAMIELRQFEDASTIIRSYQINFIPGPLQTIEYARMLTTRSKTPHPAELERRIELRLAHADELLARPDGPALYVVMDESALLRPTGGPQLIAEALEHVVNVAADPRHRIRVLPLTSTAPLYYGPFMLCDLDDHGSAMLYRENGYTDEAVHSDEEVQRHRETFDEMWDASLDEKASLRRIKAAIADYRSHT